MKNKELFILKKGLDEICNLNLIGAKFCYCISKNKRLLEQEIKDINNSYPSSEEFKQYDKERIEICNKYGKKDEKGEFIFTTNGSYVIENKEEFDKEIELLNNKNKTIIDERQKQIDNLNDFLEEESSFKPFLINIEEVPNNINSNQFDKIFYIIEEGEKENK